jgi:DNA polymerase I-like protein with 3'-5' exonuclease and polymerase domains
MEAGINLKLAECKDFQDKMFTRYHRWAEWREEIIAEARTKHALRNSFGKWAPFIMNTPAKAVNFNPQSCAACALWYSLPRVEATIAPFQGKMVTTVHDEILIQAPYDCWREAATAAKAVMETRWPQLKDTSIPVDVKVGLNWKEMLPMDSPIIDLYGFEMGEPKL